MYGGMISAIEAGATNDVTRALENVPAEVAKAFHFKLDQPEPVNHAGPTLPFRPVFRRPNTGSACRSAATFQFPRP
jgi:hypothetical protein